MPVHLCYNINMTKEALRIAGSYGWADMDTECLTRRFKVAVKRLVEIRKEHPFDTIAFRGASGSALGFVAGIALQTKVVYVRKESEKSHGYKVECNEVAPIKSYVIVDDFISTGATIKEILKRLNKTAVQNEQKAPTCAGILLYDSQGQDRLHQVLGLKIPIWHVSERSR